jgi:hypothetical protein
MAEQMTNNQAAERAGHTIPVPRSPEHVRPPETVDLPVHERPRVVLFRPNSIESDSRAKKFSMTLDRLGYEVFALSAEEVGAPTAPRALAGVQVVPVPLSRTSRERHVHKVAARRQRRLHLIDWTSRDEFITQVQELRRSVRAARRSAYKALHGPPPEGGSLVPRHVRVGYWLGVEAVSRVRLASRRMRWPMSPIAWPGVAGTPGA